MVQQPCSTAPPAPEPEYVGRFAPSPTGPLHLGSLVAAVASYLDARHHHGRWLLRIEDIDRPREVAGATAEIIRQLAAHGLHHDDEIVYQTTRDAAYATAIDELGAKGMTYFCRCPRSATRHGRYPGTCKTRGFSGENAALRVRMERGVVHCNDLLHGDIGADVAETVGDFVIRRRDGLVAYQLAVVVDDAAARITHVVRGADLLDNSPRQVALQRLLDLPTPSYLHVPLLVDAKGQKLSKQNFAPRLSPDSYGNLVQTLRILGQPVPGPGTAKDCEELLLHAVKSWHRAGIPRILAVRAT